MSAAQMRFEKWEALGNDFLVVELPEDTLSASAVERLCDRRRGVGGDGVLVVAGAGLARPRMVVRNADGSRPEMCGNGLRCVAGYLAGGAAAATLLVETDAGAKRCEVAREPDGAFQVRVDMGRATLEPDLVVPFEGRERVFARVSTGNPHAITFEPCDEATFDRLGPLVATLPAGGTNVEICERLAPIAEGGAPVLRVTVWERGVGRTLACGTGACAVAALACARGAAPLETPIPVLLPGGMLEVHVSPGLAMTMRGPARRVFAGEIELP